MKSIVIAFIATFFTVTLMAQTVEDIRDLAGKNQWDKAKEQIDKYLASDKNTKTGEGWYLKAVIYNNLARDAKFSIQFPNAREESFNAYKKYLELDKNAFEGKMNQHGVLFDVASGYLSNATDEFNTKKFEQALADFLQAEKVQEYIVSKEFTYGAFAFPAYDTQLYLNIAAAAVNAKKEDVAIKYYEKIADKKIKGESFEEIYRYLVDSYDKKGDKAKMEKYLAIGKELYPKDEFWCQIGIAEAWDDKRKLFTVFETLINGSCATYVNYYNYAVELFNYSFTQEKRPEDFATLQAKIPELIKKALAIKPTVEANMLMARYYFGHINDLFDASNAVKGGKPEDIKKRADINTQLNKRYEEMLPYAMAAYEELNAKETLKAGEKGTMKIVLNMLVEYWERKKDAAKLKMFQDKMKAVE
jgi:tetratricopeptide (TPR) repeat protein